ncbi:MAG TPA: Mur ligase domain-containing protein, partial [Candidatus Limnocylindrales bacterium]
MIDPLGPPPRSGSESFDAAEIARLSGGRLVQDAGRPIRGAAVDSRRVVPGNLFVALPGERTDGHEHLAEAVANGAAAVLVSRPGLPAGDLAST